MGEIQTGEEKEKEKKDLPSKAALAAGVGRSLRVELGTVCVHKSISWTYMGSLELLSEP